MSMAKYRGLTNKARKEVKGYYCKVEGKSYIIPDDSKIVEVDFTLVLGVVGFIAVDPETVGQFIGIKDKNKKEIVGSIPIDGKMSKGGDIVRFSSHQYLAEIRYYPEHAAFLFDSHNEETRNNPQAIMVWGDELEVIGSVANNPELLEVKE